MHTKKATVLILMSLFAGAVYIYPNAVDEFPIFDMNIGTRNASLAGAFTALSDDSSGIYSNPAGISAISKSEINAGYDKWLMDASFQYLNIASPAGPGVISGSVLYSNMGTFQERDIYGIPNGNSIQTNTIGGVLGYGMHINDSFCAGLGAKVLYSSFGDIPSAGFMLDAGAQYKFGLITLGAAAVNVELAPVAFANYGLNGGAAAVLLESDNHKITMSIDAKFLNRYNMSYAVGIEYLMFKAVSIRFGYKAGPENAMTGNTAGLAAGAGVEVAGIQFEYALESMGDLGYTYMAGVKFDFQSEEENEKHNYEKLQQFMAYQAFLEAQDFYDAGDWKNAFIKFSEVKNLYPSYEGIDRSIRLAQKMMSNAGDMKKADKLFEDGMIKYENGDFTGASKIWENAKRINPEIKDIDTWMQDAVDMSGNMKVAGLAEKYFKEGLISYNECDYTEAINKWQEGLKKDASNIKLIQYIERARIKKLEIQDDIIKARAEVAKDATVVEGIRKLRKMQSLCPAYKDTAEILETLAELINEKVKQYYFKGIEKYTNGNMDAAIVYWRSIEELDPKSEYVGKVKRYIEDALNKMKAVKKLQK
jgi:tetratricopeptide (TPR) repeat protein